MKTCQRCKKDSDQSQFIRSIKYKDGFYPYCKGCRNEMRQLSLAKNPLCSMCKQKPHMKKHSYCLDCSRTACGRPLERKMIKDMSNKLCCRCKERPKRKGGDYCVECGNEKKNLWYKLNGHANRTTPEYRLHHGARDFVRRMVQTGKISKKPCEVCGNPDVEAHHYKGYDKENWLDIVWLCTEDHVEIERWANKRLTALIAWVMNIRLRNRSFASAIG